MVGEREKKKEMDKSNKTGIDKNVAGKEKDQVW